MDGRFRWLNEPIIVVPAFGLMVGLGVAPFALWGAAGAPAFYGSLTAALIAAGAVVGNSRMQADEHERQRRTQIDRQARSDLLLLHGYLAYLINSLTMYAGMCGHADFDLKPGEVPKPSDRGNWSVFQLRSLVREGEVGRLETALSQSTQASSELSAKIAGTLHKIILLVDKSMRHPGVPDEHKLTRVVLEKTAHNVSRGAEDLRISKDLLENYMREKGYLI